MTDLSLSDLPSLLGYQFFQNALIGGTLASAACAAIGLFLLLRRQALIGEGLAHMSFGGIALGLFLGVYPIYTALLLSIAATIVITHLQRKGLAHSDATIGIVVSFGLSLGLVLVSLSKGFNVDLFSYLFGSILTMDAQDLVTSAVMAAAILIFVLILYKEVLYITFDERSARVSGVPVETIELSFNVLVAVTVTLSIKLIGILLVTGILIIPGVSALQLRSSFRGTMAAAVGVAVVSVVSGIIISALADLPASAMIIFSSMVAAVICAIYGKLGD
ncbi:MAG: metal ABC transporter permease [Thermoplasmatota archaeon]